VRWCVVGVLVDDTLMSGGLSKILWRAMYLPLLM
jgi:hypothetical protein